MDTTSLTATYSSYFVTFNSVVPASNGVTLFLRTSTNGGSSYANSGYQASNSVGGSSSTSGIILTNNNDLGNSSNYGANGVLWIHNPSGGSARTVINGSSTYGNTSAVLLQGTFAGLQDSANTAINAVQFIMSTGNISSGVIKIYGVP